MVENQLLDATGCQKKTSLPFFCNSLWICHEHFGWSYIIDLNGRGTSIQFPSLFVHAPWIEIRMISGLLEIQRIFLVPEQVFEILGLGTLEDAMIARQKKRSNYHCWLQFIVWLFICAITKWYLVELASKKHPAHYKLAALVRRVYKCTSVVKIKPAPSNSAKVRVRIILLVEGLEVPQTFGGVKLQLNASPEPPSHTQCIDYIAPSCSRMDQKPWPIWIQAR